MTRFSLSLLFLVGACSPALTADQPPRSPKEALQPFNDLIGSWRGTGQPEGSRADKQRGFWTETLSWEWQFKGADAWLKVEFDKGKHWSKGELRFVADKNIYRFTAQTPAGDSLAFEGELKDKVLTLERNDEKKKETQQLVFSLLHSNRVLYRYQVRTAAGRGFNRLYQVACTKEGVSFAAGDGKPECVVSGGLGTIRVSHKGKDYYVCCSGCRDAFKEDPEKYIKEYEEKKAKEAKK
jgi:hypothetical protein